MKNRNIIFAWIFVVSLAYGCHKALDKAQEWSDNQPTPTGASGYSSVGYPYHPKP